MKLVVITPSKTTTSEITEIIKMFEAGLDTLHVRKIHYSTKELSEYIKQIPIHFHNRLIIHTHHKLALKYNLKGIHYTAKHLNKPFKLWWNTKLIYLRRPKLLKSISYKCTKEVYIPIKQKTDYCFLGTMFHNISGELFSGFYKETVEAVNLKSGKQIIARGGINLKSIKLAHELGFFGVALYSYLWKSTQPHENYMAFITYCKAQNIPIE